MQSTSNIVPVAHHHAHAHFYDWIEFEDHLPQGPSLEEQHKETIKKLRHQYLHDNHFEQKLCLRTCFKITQKKYVEYCLEKKCGGINIIDAAKIMGYYKAAPTTNTHGHHKHH